MKLYIKYMVSLRCKMVVKEALKKLGVSYIMLELGLVEIMEDLSPEKRMQLKIDLAKSGLELMDDKKSILIEKIKSIVNCSCSSFGGIYYLGIPGRRQGKTL